MADSIVTAIEAANPLKSYVQAIEIGAVLLVVAAITGAIWYHGHEQYKAGYAAADATWTTKYNAAVNEHNQKIVKLEQDTTTKVTALQTANATLSSKLAGTISSLNDAKAKLAFNQRHGADGKVITVTTPCDGTVYLGNDFTTMWNGLNRVVNDSIKK